MICGFHDKSSLTVPHPRDDEHISLVQSMVYPRMMEGWIDVLKQKKENWEELRFRRACQIPANKHGTEIVKD